MIYFPLEKSKYCIKVEVIIIFLRLKRRQSGLDTFSSGKIKLKKKSELENGFSDNTLVFTSKYDNEQNKSYVFVSSGIPFGI